MFSKAAILLGVLLVLFGYRLGKPKPAPPPAQVVLKPCAPKKEWLSVKILLIIVIVLLVIAILSSLQQRW